MTISNGWVNGDDWVLMARTGSLIVPGGAVSIAYRMGR
jgi:hypothetical protein